MKILYISEVQWRSQVSRKHQMIRRFPADWEVLFLSPANLARDENSFRVRSERVPARVEYASVLLPKPNSGVALLRALTPVLMAAGGARVMRMLRRFAPDVVVCSYLWAAPLLPRIRALGIPVVYDLNDLHPQFFPAARDDADRLFRELVAGATEVVASSESLQKEAGRGRTIGNGVDLEMFRGRVEGPRPPELAGGAVGACEKLVMYVGSVDDRIDVGILRRLLETLAAGDAGTGVVLVGRIFDSARDACQTLQRAFPSILFLTGRVQYHRLPALMSHADVGIAPFVLAPKTEAINPNKLYMYAAMDMNIVSTPFSDEVRRHGDLISIASSPADFASAVESAIGDDERRRSLRERIALPNSWAERAEEFTRLLSDLAQGD
jgi:teichuronic acid biosynthesis glycosyltransferase TuaH